MYRNKNDFLFVFYSKQCIVITNVKLSVLRKV